MGLVQAFKNLAFWQKALLLFVASFVIASAVFMLPKLGGGAVLQCAEDELLTDGECVGIECEGIVVNHVCTEHECTLDEHCNPTQKCVDYACVDALA
ncbi:MAG: hypothetical protein JW834_02935 [Candidatus Diapherotrites archaeon]|nr:hypothetical protein [Candidatus Diapherotrites archaeon]